MHIHIFIIAHLNILYEYFLEFPLKLFYNKTYFHFYQKICFSLHIYLPYLDVFLPDNDSFFAGYKKTLFYTGKLKKLQKKGFQCC